MFSVSPDSRVSLTLGPEVLFKTCVAMKFVDDDDDDLTTYLRDY